MDGRNNTNTFSCFPATTGHVSIALLFLALPFHFLVGKILAFNLRFENPRHVVLFCLSASDSLQLTVMAFAMITSTIGDIQTGTQSCAGLRYAIIFTATLTFVVSSLTLVALSIERYIACFHSYRINELLTNKIIIAILVAFWICGAIGGGIACISGLQANEKAILPNSGNFKVIFISLTFLVSLVLIVVQSLLFHLSRKKLNCVQPGPSSLNDNNAEIQRKRQIKVAIVASVVVLSYLICMLPSACVTIANYKIAESTSKFGKQMVVISLSLINTLLNPFIYGFGMLDTRKATVKEVKKIKNYLLVKLRLRDALET